RHGVADRIEFVESDLFAAVSAEQQFDLIISNPPYIADQEMSRLPATVGEHEPRASLAAGPRGLDVIEPLIAQSVQRLAACGSLFFEISPMLQTAVAELLQAGGVWAEPRLIRDLAGQVRVCHARVC